MGTAAPSEQIYWLAKGLDQETSKEILAGSLPRSFDVILRQLDCETCWGVTHDISLASKPTWTDQIIVNFKCSLEMINHNLSPCRVIFTGIVVVIPDIFTLASPGERSECRWEASQCKGYLLERKMWGALGLWDLEISHIL